MVCLLPPSVSSFPFFFFSSSETKCTVLQCLVHGARQVSNNLAITMQPLVSFALLSQCTLGVTRPACFLVKSSELSTPSIFKLRAWVRLWSLACRKMALLCTNLFFFSCALSLYTALVSVCEWMWWKMVKWFCKLVTNCKLACVSSPVSRNVCKVLSWTWEALWFSLSVTLCLGYAVAPPTFWFSWKLTEHKEPAPDSGWQLVFAKYQLGFPPGKFCINNVTVPATSPKTSNGERKECSYFLKTLGNLILA